MPFFKKKRPCPDLNRDGTVELGEDCFDEYVAKHPKVVLMFYSPTCRHSLAMEPVFAELRSEMGDQIAFCKARMSSAELTNRYPVPGTPTFFFVKEGTALSRVVGEARKDVLRTEAMKLL